MGYYVLMGLRALAFALIGTAGLLLLWGKPVLVIYIQIVFSNMMRYLSQNTPLPESIKYIADLLTLLLLVRLIIAPKEKLEYNLRKPFFAVALFALVALITSVAHFPVHSSNVVFFFWGIRIYFRFYVFFLACATFLSIKDIENIFTILLFLLPVNTVLCSIQYFIQGYRFDFLGGLYGNLPGCNGEMNGYLLVVASILVVRYVHGKMNAFLAVSGIVMILYIAALSELKALFVEVPLLLAVIIFFTFPNPRSVILTVCGVCAVAALLPLFTYLYPNWTGFFSMDSIRDYTTVANYAEDSGLNRLTAGKYILENVHLTIPGKLFGIGLGNGDYFLTYASWFYQQYSYLVYHYFLYSFLILEVGILGLIAYGTFFIATLWDSIVTAKRVNDSSAYLCYVTLSMSILVYFLLIYNASIRGEVAYMLYFVLSIPYIVQNVRGKAERQKKISAENALKGLS